MPSRRRAGLRPNTPVPTPAPTNPTTLVEDVEEQLPTQDPPNTPAPSTQSGGVPATNQPSPTAGTGDFQDEEESDTNSVIEIDFWDSTDNPEVISLNHLMTVVNKPE